MPDNEHSALFDAFPNSYGTLGYALRLQIELLPVKPYVQLRHVRFDDAEQAFESDSPRNAQTGFTTSSTERCSAVMNCI